MGVITAKRPGTCAECGEAFEAGARIRWYRNGACYPIECKCKQEGNGAGNGGAVRVNTYQVGGKTYTRNARGLCEDAPCCGCCTI